MHMDCIKLPVIGSRNAAVMQSMFITKQALPDRGGICIAAYCIAGYASRHMHRGICIAAYPSRDRGIAGMSLTAQGSPDSAWPVRAAAPPVSRTARAAIAMEAERRG